MQRSRRKDIFTAEVIAVSFKVRVFCDISVDFIFIIRVMIMYPINLDSFVVSSVKLHNLGSCRKKDAKIRFERSITNVFAFQKHVGFTSLCLYGGRELFPLRVCPSFLFIIFSPQEKEGKLSLEAKRQYGEVSGFHISVLTLSQCFRGVKMLLTLPASQ